MRPLCCQARVLRWREWELHLGNVDFHSALQFLTRLECIPTLAKLIPELFANRTVFTNISPYPINALHIDNSWKVGTQIFPLPKMAWFTHNGPCWIFKWCWTIIREEPHRSSVHKTDHTASVRRSRTLQWVSHSPKLRLLDWMGLIWWVSFRSYQRIQPGLIFHREAHTPPCDKKSRRVGFNRSNSRFAIALRFGCAP